MPPTLSHQVETPPPGDHDSWSSLALEFLDQGVTVFDHNLRLVAWNSRAKTLLGLPDQLMRADTSLEAFFVYNAERDEYGDGDIDALVTERIALAKMFKPHSFERARPDGTVIEVRGTPLPNHEGFVTTYTDITEQKLTEQELEQRVERRTHALRKESEARQETAEALRRNEIWIRKITDTVPVLIAYVSSTLEYQFANQMHQEWFNLAPEALLDTSIFERVEKRNQAQFRQDVRTVLTGELVNNDYTITHHDGHLLEVSITFVPHVNEHNIIEGFFFLGQDLTEFNLSQRQLAESHKMQALGQMTGGIAHDFNNLLTIILGNLSLLKSAESNTEEIQEIGLACSRAARRGGELIQRLLTFSRRQALNPSPTNINALIIDLRELLKRTLGENFDITTELSADLPNVQVDPNQLETSLLNLALNARDAMPNGGTLTISTQCNTQNTQGASKPCNTVRLRVSDQGIGMSKQTIERAFEPFFSTKAKGSGTGLGLSMVYGFVKQSDGHIHIQSQLNRGTTVEITLPIASHLADEPKPKPVRTLDAPATEKILLVEDDEGVRNYVSRALRQLGYQVEVAHNGDQALDLLQSNQPSTPTGSSPRGFNLVLTDIVMPGKINGLALADYIQKHLPQTKVLCMTGYSEQLDEKIDSQMLINKPFSTNELAEKLKQRLENHLSADANRTPVTS